MEIREMVEKCLPKGAFLRRDRGDGMYVTNAPARGWSGEIPGFGVEINGPIARLSILPRTMESCSYAPDRLAEELDRFRGSSLEAAAVFTECIKCVESPERNCYDKCDRLVRQAAAVALRRGGYAGLYYCALALAEAGRRLDDKKGR